MKRYHQTCVVWPEFFAGASDTQAFEVLSIAKVARGGEAYYLDPVSSMGQGVSCAGSDRAGSDRAGINGAGPDSSPGLWLGAGTGHLGLEGLVAPVHLTSLLGGRDPLSGQELDPGHANRVKVVAFDLTFAAPKSVSLIFGLCDDERASEVRSGHLAAVGGALRYLETSGMAARRTAGGQRNQIQISGALAAGFTHVVSRRLDPHLHTHVLVVNLAEGADGRWSALDARGLYVEALTAGYLYQAHLRSELTERLGVAWSPLHRGAADVKGVDPEVIVAFSSRKVEIERHLTERGLSGPRARRIAVAATRPAKDSQAGLHELRRQWIERASALGLDVEAIMSPLARHVAASHHAAASRPTAARRTEMRAMPAAPQRSRPDLALTLEVTAVLAMGSGEHTAHRGEPARSPGSKLLKGSSTFPGVTAEVYPAMSATLALTTSFTRGEVVRAWCRVLPSGAPATVIEEHTRRYLASGMVMKLPQPSGGHFQPVRRGLPGALPTRIAVGGLFSERWAVPRSVVVLMRAAGVQHFEGLSSAGLSNDPGRNLQADQEARRGNQDARSRASAPWRESGVLMAEAWDPVARIARAQGLLPGAPAFAERERLHTGAAGAHRASRTERKERTEPAAEQGAPELLGVIRSGAELAASRSLASLCGELDALRAEIASSLGLAPAMSDHVAIEVATSAGADRTQGAWGAQGAQAARTGEIAPMDLHRSQLVRYSELSAGVEVRASRLATAAMVSPPAHLLERLGPVPDAVADRDVWYRAARSVESYRERWNVSDPASALGALEGRSEQRSRAASTDSTRPEARPATASRTVQSFQRLSMLRTLEGAERRLAPGARAASASLPIPGERVQEGPEQRLRQSLGLRAGRVVLARPERDLGRGR